MLKQLQKELSAEKKDKNIFDIVIYGSAVKGKIKPNDIDIAVIFRSGSLRERLDKLQQIKKIIKSAAKIDLKGILWEELFHEEFFARSGLLLEGISLFEGHPFAEKLGFYASSLFIYSLKDKSHTSKVKFNYLLNGRQGPGILKKMGGEWLSPGMVQIPIMNSFEFDEVLQKNNINYKKKNILIQI